MTANNILERYAPRIERQKPAEEPGAIDDFLVFGILRGTHERALMLELRMADGNSVAFSYAYLASASFDPSQGIILQFAGRKVTIAGTRLNEGKQGIRLYESILRHRVVWVQEADAHAARRATADTVIIDSIEIDP